MNSDRSNVVVCLKNENGYLVAYETKDENVCRYSTDKSLTEDYDYVKAINVKNLLRRTLGVEFDIVVKGEKHG